MSDIKIQKVKLVKSGEKLEISFKETGDMVSTVDKVCENPIHPDFKKAVDGLACHLAILTDYLTERRAMDKEELEKFVVTGYSIGGKEEDEGVTITGYRKTRSGKTVTLNTPFLKLESDSEEYYLIADLNSKIEAIEAEVTAYLEGKKAPDAQLDMFAGTEEPKKPEKIDKIIIDHPQSEYTGTSESPVVKMADAPKKASKKKVAQSAEVPSGELVIND